MEEILFLLIDQLFSWSVLELIAVITAIAYLILVIKQIIWCWFFAVISTSIYIYLFFSANLYMESLLNLFYFFMAIYGWINWHSRHKFGEYLVVSIFSFRIHFIVLIMLFLITLLLGQWLSQNTDAIYPFLDTGTSLLAIWGTFLVARKKLENWFYWFLIDVVSVWIYWTRGLELTAILYIFYILIIPIGFLSWLNSYQKSRN